MLKIQRASAGSGKTYTLAKQFVQNLLAYQDEKGNWILRKGRQIEDTLTHLLAITFTNKATNEMKSRIVSSLSLLAKASQNNLSKEEKSKIPYLKDLTSLTGESEENVGNAAHTALKYVLNDFSSFKVTTIDSFFQEILRTFVYEANINHSYQVEIDSSYVADAALDSAIQELDTHPHLMGNASFWLKNIMNLESKKSQKWNLFNKKATKGSIYAKLRSALQQLEKEDFQEVKDALDIYFSEPSNLVELQNVYTNLKDKATKEREDLLETIHSNSKKISQYIEENNIPKKHINNNLHNQLGRLIEWPKSEKSSISHNWFSNKKEKNVFNSRHGNLDHPINAWASEMYDALAKWLNPSSESFYKNWLIYGELLPYLGLIYEVKSFLSQIMEENNIIKLSDTGYILKKIIGDEDAPFVYERLGNRIDNYLIDEFQDTSKMQWDILKPLVSEGIAKNKDSLIIGDPKQSIYRFRNADHKLITHTVPEDFPSHVAAGYTNEENTNWRSHTLIVKFNNYFFKQLASLLSGISAVQGNSYDFDSLYSNVVQYPNNQQGKGYVEIRVLKKPADEVDSDKEDYEEDDSNNNVGWFDRMAMAQVGPLIYSLIERGYKAKDIAVLVNRNQKGEDIVKALIDYNDSLAPDKKINFMSEESLLLSSSAAVEIIIGIIEKLSQRNILPAPPEIIEEEGVRLKKRAYVNWKDIKIGYQIYSKLNQEPGITEGEKIISFLEKENIDFVLPNLIAELPTPSLSSLIEMSIKTFLTDEMVKSEAVYLSAFQDAVTEYLSSHDNDPASFLDWWKKKGIRKSISTPEGTDAVQIMTIHKAKGLEFKCVIVPFSKESFRPSNDYPEWRWVKSSNKLELALPPVVPVNTNKNLMNSEHEIHYREYFDQVLTDNLNKYYVAYTRAKNELYIFTSEVIKKVDSLNVFIKTILQEIKDPDCSDIESSDLEMDPKELFTSSESVITYGQPFSSKEIKEEYLKETLKSLSEPDNESHYFQGYYVNTHRPCLRSLASKTLPSSEV